MPNDNKIVLFESSDGEVFLDAFFKDDTVWLSKDQMVKLFDRDRTVISRHISNIYKEHEVDQESTCAKFAQVRSEGEREVSRQLDYYNLDVIISVGYRVKSQRGIEFRKWASSVLKQHIISGFSLNKKRLEQLGTVIEVLKRSQKILDSAEIIDVIKTYAFALNILDDYDHQQIKKPAGTKAVYVLEYNECRELISKMKFAKESNVFGVEKDDSFKSSISAIYQSFDGCDIYPSLEEKAANLLYFIVKNHSFHDGNKRIAATLFLHFLNKSNALFICGKKRLADSTLAALTIMIAQSRPEEKEVMVSLVMNFLEFDKKELGL